MSGNKKEKWQLLGFEGKADYVGWLSFNGLVDEMYSYDNAYRDEYSGDVINLGDTSVISLTELELSEEDTDMSEE